MVVMAPRGMRPGQSQASERSFTSFRSVRIAPVGFWSWAVILGAPYGWAWVDLYGVIISDVWRHLCALFFIIFHHEDTKNTKGNAGNR